MARDYDSQLLESVAVRRRRLRDALLFGSQRIRRSLEEGLGRVFGGIALATVLCAGCVGWSFIAEQRAKDDKSPGQPTPSPLVPVPASAVPQQSGAAPPQSGAALRPHPAPPPVPSTAPPSPALAVGVSAR
ncbi:MAG TPA: hypothetical protein VLH10_18240 [Yinghuangia sp.]|nr:hypothetical protein [Yinghuangia sp.]